MNGLTKQQASELVAWIDTYQCHTISELRKNTHSLDKDYLQGKKDATRVILLKLMELTGDSEGAELTQMLIDTASSYRSDGSVRPKNDKEIL